MPDIVVDWSGSIGVSKTATTLQVVSNALLDRKTPVSSAFFKTLGALQLHNVRYVPWFPMPHYGVPELLPPNKSATSWDFTDALPMLLDVLAATAGNGTTAMPNFSTQPAWMYEGWPGPSFPSDPRATDFGYPNHGTKLRDPSGAELVAYYQRLLQWMVHGEFVDENGVKHTGGPAVRLSQWEVFNEPQGCHGMNAGEYTRLYDLIVAGIREAVDPDGTQMRFAIGALEQRDQAEWAEYLLNPHNHASGPGRDSLDTGLLTFHFYAGASSRTDPQAYEGFFPAVDGFVSGVLAQILQARASLSPRTLLSCDEMGVILPDDNSPNAAAFPLVYWNAAAAKYAYMFQAFSRLGVEIAGMSQLAGNPVLPEWGITDPQFPSVAILNWTTGEGTARYWTLKLIGDTLKPGAALHKTVLATNPMCGVATGSGDDYGNVTLRCADAGAVISAIDFADFGTPAGGCGQYQHNASCTTPGVLAYAQSHCVGKQSCQVPSWPYWPDPCYHVVKSLVVQARCSHGGGIAEPGSNGVAGQAYSSGSSRQVLLVNKESTPSTVNVTTLVSQAGPSGLSATIVDEATGFGPARTEAVPGPTLTLQPFAVAIVFL